LAGFSDFVAELNRRRMVRALLGWGIDSFAILQVYEPVMHGLHLPEWALSFVVVAGPGQPVSVTAVTRLERRFELPTRLGS